MGGLRTTYEGPIELASIEVGGRMIRLARPGDPDRLLNDPSILKLNRDDDYMPYWAYVWPGAYLLAEAVAREHWAERTPCLEIGCGVGLAGLVGLRRGLQVRFTDYDETPLRFVERSAKENGFAADLFSTARLDWRKPPDERYRVILGADVLYERRLVPLVCDVIARMLKPDGIALVAGPFRVATEDLANCLESHSLRADAEPIAARTEAGETVRGTLHRIRQVRT